MSNYTLNYDFESIKFKFNQYKNIFIFTGGIFPEPSSARKFLKNFNVPDFIIAADSGLEALDLYNSKLKKKYVPNVILGDMDSIKNKRLIKKYQALGSQVEFFDTYKDFTDTELALILAKKVRKGKSLVTLIGGSGGRIDHLLAIYDLFSSPVAPDFWLTESQVLTFLPRNASVQITTSKKNSPVSVLRTTTSNRGGRVISSGLEWEGPLFRKCGVPSLSNEVSAKSFKVRGSDLSRGSGLPHGSDLLTATLTAKGASFVIAADFTTLIKIVE